MSRRGPGAALLLASWLVAVAPAAARSSFVVHLPSAPIEAASRLDEAVAALSDYLSEQVPGLDVELRLFRRWSDANDFLETNGDDVVLLLTDASFLLDRAGQAGLEPTHRLWRSGRPTYRRVLVVRNDLEAVRKLVDLRGRSLSVVETSGPSGLVFLERAVFENEISPLDWFGKLEQVPDDFSAANAVLYGQSDAALVAEHNPLLSSHLGEDLRTIYTSPALSLPVLAIRGSSFDASRRAALDEALRKLGEDARGQKVLSELELDRIEAVESAEASALLAWPKPAGKQLEIALPGAADAPAFALPPLPPADQLPFTVTVELPDIPLPRKDAQ